VKFGIRPEHLEAPEGAAIEVEVDVVEQLGSTSFLYATTSRGEPIIAEQRTGRARAGEHAALRFNPADARVFSADGMRIR
jgi:lactose/L-arabinose transport system ATP-binding protein